MNYVGRCFLSNKPKRPQATRNVWKTYDYGSGVTYALHRKRVIQKRRNGEQEYWHAPMVNLRGIKFDQPSNSPLPVQTQKR